jgi:hypothetical protein
VCLRHRHGRPIAFSISRFLTDACSLLALSGRAHSSPPSPLLTHSGLTVVLPSRASRTAGREADILTNGENGISRAISSLDSLLTSQGRRLHHRRSEQ